MHTFSLPAIFWSHFVSAVFSSALAFYSYRNRNSAGVRALILLLLAAAGWNLAAAINEISPSPPGSNFWLVVQYLSAAVAASSMLAFSLQYSGSWQAHRKLYLVLLTLLPFFHLAFILTNPYHQLLWLSNDQPNLVLSLPGPALFAFHSLNFILAAASAANLLHTALTCSPIYRWQARLALAGICLPIAAYLLELITCSRGPGSCQFTPLMVGVTGFVWVFASFRLHVPRSSQTRDFDLLQSINDGILIISQDGHVVYCNPAFQKYFQLLPLQVIGKKVEDLLPKIRAMLSSPPSKEPAIGEVAFGARYFRVQIQNFINFAREREGQFIIFTDITERWEAEQALKQRETKYRDIVEFQSDLITVWLPDTTLTFANDAYCRYFEKPYEEVIQHPFVHDRPPETQDIIRDAIARLFAGEESVTTEEFNFFNNHEKRWTQWTYLPLKEDGQIVAVQSVGRDITERKNMEVQLRKSEERYRTILDQQTELVVRWLPDATITFANQAYCRFHGKTSEQLVGSSLFLLLTDEERQKFVRLYQELEQNGIIRFESFSVDVNGNSVCVLWTDQAIRGPDGKITEVLSVGRDITDRKRAEEAERAARHMAETLRNIGTELSRSLETEQILNKMLELIASVIPYDSANFLQIKDNRAVTTRGRNYEEFGQEAVLAAETIGLKIDEVYNLRWMMENKQALLVANISQDANWVTVEGLSHIQSWIGAPVQVYGKVVGFFSLDGTRPDQFTQDHLRYLNIFAGQAGLALENAKLYETARQRAREAETLQEVAMVVNRSLDQQKIFDLILEQLELVIAYDSAAILLQNEKGTEIVGGRGFANLNAVLGIQFPDDDTTPNTVVIKTQKPLILDDAPLHYAEFARPPHSGIRGWMGVPLTIQDRVIGLLVMDSRKPDYFTQDHARLAEAFASQVAITIENARLFQETQRLAITDPLTGCYNRRFFFDQVAREKDRSQRFNRPMALIMIDLDHFKYINDRFGHRVGDQVLVVLIQRIQTELRSMDILGRYGGEEFVILLPETSHDKAMTVAERIRKLVEEREFDLEKASVSITVSQGVMVYQPPEDVTVDELLDRADQAMYIAKRSGRNRVHFWKDLS